MLHDLKLKIQQYLSREWTGFLWLLIPISLLPLNLISAFLTGGGHAPYFMYLPFVILYGPSLVTYKVINWNEFWPILWVPLLLYVIYAVILRLSPPTRRWRLLQTILGIHGACGLAFFFWTYRLIALYVSLAIASTALFVWLFRRNGRPVQVVIACVSILFFSFFPTWDILHAEREFSRLCKQEAGIRVHKSADGVEGFTIGQWAPGKIELLTSFGYRYLEMEDGDNWFRYGLDKQGNVTREVISGPQARYQMRYREMEYKNVLAMQDFILDTKTNDILGTRTEFTPTGGWFAHQLEDRPSRRERCGQESQYKEVIIPELITKALIPTP